jgi:hypothetical protein
MSSCPGCRTSLDQWVYVSEIRRFQPPCGHPCVDHAKALGATQDSELVRLLPHPPSPFWHSHDRLVLGPGRRAWKRQLTDRPSETHCSIRHPDEPGRWMIFEPVKDFTPAEPAECTVTLCESKDQLLLLPCGHWACEPCLSQEALAQARSASCWLASGRLRCPYCRSHFSLDLLDPESFTLRCIRLVFSSVRLRWECKLKILILMLEAEAERLRQLVELLVLLRSPPTRAMVRKLDRYRQNRGQTQLRFAWNRVSRTFQCSLS